MLKFLNEVPVYDFNEACVVFTGLNRRGPVTCHVTRTAILERAGLDDASAVQLVAAFAQHRLFFEDIACVLNLRDSGSVIVIDDMHLHEPAFASWQPAASAMSYEDRRFA